MKEFDVPFYAAIGRGAAIQSALNLGVNAILWALINREPAVGGVFPKPG